MNVFRRGREWRRKLWPIKKQPLDYRLEYQVEPYDYYVSDYFMLKSLQYVMKYKDDPQVADLELYEIACNEMVKHNKVSLKDLEEHVHNIESLKR